MINLSTSDLEVRIRFFASTDTPACPYSQSISDTQEKACRDTRRKQDGKKVIGCTFPDLRERLCKISMFDVDQSTIRGKCFLKRQMMFEAKLHPKVKGENIAA